MPANLSICIKLSMTCRTEDRSKAAPIAERADKTVQWHLITPEYPPQRGGVSDYTCQLAAGLAGLGDEVHVWAPGSSEEPIEANTKPEHELLTLHRECGHFAPADLRAVGDRLDRFPAPRHLLVQWVPHGYGYRSMNLAFCWWIYQRAVRHRDRVELMVHEPFLRFEWKSPRRNLAALVHRWMTILLLRATARVWMSIPGWERILRIYALGRAISFRWLPIFSNIPAASDASRTQTIRRQYADSGQLLIGHFGTFGAGVTNLLGPIVTALARDSNQRTILLMGDGSEEYRSALIRQEPKLETAIRATGKLSASEVSHHLAACDLLIQPYPDGVSSRRTSLMAGLENGKPIVTTSGWLTESLWLESDAVAIAPAGDTGAFLKEVRRLCDQRSERLRLGAAAGRLYRERFDISRTITSLREAQAAGEGECVSS
jgi:glycosyltransferase involved in cell wall biosynthesis